MIILGFLNSVNCFYISIVSLEMLMEMGGHLNCMDEPHPGEISKKPRPGIREEKEKEELFSFKKKSKVWPFKK